MDIQFLTELLVPKNVRCLEVLENIYKWMLLSILETQVDRSLI
jgi:hypothetical protein